MTPAEPVPDLTASIMRVDRRRARRSHRHVDERTQFLRITLAVIALIQLGMAIPALILGDDAGLPTHVARHLGSFSLALGVGLLVVAFRPDRASGVLPVVAAARPLPARELGHRHRPGNGGPGRRGQPRARAGRAWSRCGSWPARPASVRATRLDLCSDDGSRLMA